MPPFCLLPPAMAAATHSAAAGSDLVPAAGGATTGTSPSRRASPPVPARLASQRPLAGEVDRPPFDPKDLSLDQGLGRLPAGGLQDASEGCPRHSHLLGGLILVEALEIGEAKRLQLIEGEYNISEVAIR